MKNIFIVCVLGLTLCCSLCMITCARKTGTDNLGMRMCLTWGNINTTGSIRVSEGSIDSIEGYDLDNDDRLDPPNLAWKTFREPLKPFNFDGIIFELNAPGSTEISIGFNNREFRITLREFMRYRKKIWQPDGTKLILSGIPLPGSKTMPEYKIPIYDYCLQTHSCISDATYFSIQEQIHSLAKYVNNVWWTDHDFWFSNDPGSTGYDFSGTGPDSPESPGNNGSFIMKKKHDGLREQIFLGSPVKSLKPVLSGIHFSFWMYPVSDLDENKGAFVQLDFGPERRYIYYLFSNQKTVNRNDTIVLPYKINEWNNYKRDVTSDYRNLYGDEDLALWFARPGGFSKKGQTVEVYFDQFQLKYDTLNKELWQFEKEYFEQYEHLIHSVCGLELTANYNGIKSMNLIQPHYTILFPPEKESLFYIPRGSFSYQVREQYFEEVHNGGGVVGVHHLNHRDIRKLLSEGIAKEVDLYEMNYDWGEVEPLNPQETKEFKKRKYPSAANISIYHCLTGWDKCTESGIYITGYSAPDLHGSFDTPRFIAETHLSYLSPGLTWIFANSNNPEDILRSLRTGRCFFGDSVDPIIVDMETSNGFPVGSLVLTDKQKYEIKIYARGKFLKNKTIHVIKNGNFWKKYRLKGSDFLRTITIPVNDNAFLRCELYDEYEHPILFTNWIAFRSTLPKKFPWGRNVLDWNGLMIRGSEGFLIHNFTFSADKKSVVIQAESAIPGSNLIIQSETVPEFYAEYTNRTVHAREGKLSIRSEGKGLFTIKLYLSNPIQTIPAAVDREAVSLRKRRSGGDKTVLKPEPQEQMYNLELLYDAPFQSIEQGDMIQSWLLMIHNKNPWIVKGGVVEYHKDTIGMIREKQSGLFCLKHSGLFCLNFDTSELRKKKLVLSIPFLDGDADIYTAVNYESSTKMLGISEPGNYTIGFKDISTRTTLPVKAIPLSAVKPKAVPADTYEYGKKSKSESEISLASKQEIVSIIFHLKSGAELRLNQMKLEYENEP